MAIFISTLVLAAAAFAEAPSSLDRARGAYARAEYRQALEILLPIQDKGTEEYYLIGRCHYIEGDFKRSAEAFQRALRTGPSKADLYDWLGRAYYRLAEIADPFHAAADALRARKSLERAVDLAPENGEYLKDLFEFYLDAPEFLGGGVEKAALLVGRIGKSDPAERESAQARLTRTRSDLKSAAWRLRQVILFAPQQVGRLIGRVNP